jgi:tetratricopeptide (TPR) repeat protein
VDPENPIVRLCAEGIQAEQAGRRDDARTLFDRAWRESSDDYEACIAAHFVARHQATQEDVLAWNEEALRRAEAVGDDRIRGFLPSLFLNLGHSHEMLGALDEAGSFYARAAARLEDLTAGPYADLVRSRVTRALDRLQ